MGCLIILLWRFFVAEFLYYMIALAWSAVFCHLFHSSFISTKQKANFSLLPIVIFCAILLPVESCVGKVVQMSRMFEKALCAVMLETSSGLMLLSLGYKAAFNTSLLKCLSSVKVLANFSAALSSHPLCGRWLKRMFRVIWFYAKIFAID